MSKTDAPGTTGFFRDAEHFHALAAALDERSLRTDQAPWLWSAGCSTGQEPYSLAMYLLQRERKRSRRPVILATDIQRDALDRACTGVFSNEEVEQIPQEYLQAFFTPAEPDGSRQAVPELRRMIRFQEHDLTDVTQSTGGPFAAILCRHTLMYLPESVRVRIVDGFVRMLEPGGLMAIGYQEELPDSCTRVFVETGRGLYQLRASAERTSDSTEQDSVNNEAIA